MVYYLLFFAINDGFVDYKRDLHRINNSTIQVHSRVETGSEAFSDRYG